MRMTIDIVSDRLILVTRQMFVVVAPPILTCHWRIAGIGHIFSPSATTVQVYRTAAQPIVLGTLEGFHGMFLVAVCHRATWFSRLAAFSSF